MTLTANAILTVSSSGLLGSADVAVDGSGTLNLGTASSTGIVIGKTDIPLTVAGSATVIGSLTLGSASTTGQLIFKNASTSFTTLLQASSSQASNLTFTLPPTAGTAGQAMLTDGSGNLYFGSIGSLQWLNGTSGTISYSSGSIGINTTTPLALLSVAGSATSTAPLFDVASSSGTSLFRITPDGNVTIGNTVSLGDAKGSVDLSAFGAKCDGTTDDHAAIQAALDYIHAAGGGQLNLPPGTCRTTSGLSYNYSTNTYGSLSIVGTGLFTSAILIDASPTTIGLDGNAR